jgi:hypothetical protein
VASFVIIRHGVVILAMEGTIVFVAKVGMFQRVGTGLGAVGSGARSEDCIIALVNKALIEEGGK